MGLLMSLIFLTELTPNERIILTTIIILMIALGAAMWYFGRKSEIRDVGTYMQSR